MSAERRSRMPFEDASGDLRQRMDALLRQARSSEPGERRFELHRLADALRDIIEHLVSTSAPLPVVTDVAAALSAVAAELAQHPHGGVHDGYAESAPAGDVHGFFDHSPLIGRANPLAPPIDVRVVEGRVEGRVTYGAAYEGPPGHVHGGHIAAAFDEVLGLAQSFSGQPGMTGTLTIRYRRPTPLRQELLFVGELSRVEGRKIFTAGRLLAGDVLCAEAEGLFITVDFERFRQDHAG